MLSESTHLGLYHPFLDDFISPDHPDRPRLITDPDNYPSRDHPLSDTDPSDLPSSPSPSPNSLFLSPAAAWLSGFSLPLVRTSPPDAEGTIIGGYTLGPIIGHGGFSTIRRASSTSGGTVAVKIVLRANLAKQGNPVLARKRLDHEAAIWASLSHEHILPLFSAIQTSYADYFFTLLCPTGSLYDIVKRYGQPAFPLDDLAVVFGQVVRGLRYLHEVAGVVHRDIKLENVLVDEMGVCRIGDFGMARKIGEIDHDPSEDHTLSRTASHSVNPRHNPSRHRNSAPPTSSAQPPQPKHAFQPGSLPYSSPELLLPPSSSPLAPHPAQDIWALGVLLYAMLTGRLPFTDSFEPRLQMKILHGAYEMPSDIGRGAERILQGCLERSVHNRWTIDMVDEVAWDIGSGAEDGDETSDTDFHTVNPRRTRSKPSTRSSSLDPSLSSSDEAITKPSLATARRRSSSRAERSLSRAPLLSRSISFASRSRSHSKQSPHRISPSLTALNNSILSLTPDSPLQFESALSLSPPTFLDRGRRPQKSQTQGTSRSPSPSVLPETPVDADRFVLPLTDDAVPSQAEYLERGRRPSRVEGSTPHSYGVADLNEAELDVMMNETTKTTTTTRWSSNGGDSKRAAGFPDLHAPSTLSSAGWQLPHRSDPAVSFQEQQQDRDRRAGSLPPAISPLWSVAGRLAWGESGVVSGGGGGGSIPSATSPSFSTTDSDNNPKPTTPPAKSISRSQSVGYQRPGELHSAFSTFLNG